MNERNDFVQFLRNVGEPSDTVLGGGTYGFGKGIFYRLSESSTIFVDSYLGGNDEESRRLMGACLGSSYYDSQDRRFTGRHWWGSIADDGIPDPLLGTDAETVASRLGMPGFHDGRTGTDIVVLSPDLGFQGDGTRVRPRTPAEAAEFIASSILWNLWPKFSDNEDAQKMNFAVLVDDVPMELPNPRDVRGLTPFVEALDIVRSGASSTYTRTVTPKVGGSLGIVQVAAKDYSENSGLARPFDGPSRHVARMRWTELVVDYLEGPEHPDNLLAYAGVFRASTDADAHFALAEPPTHDDWVEKGLSGVDRGVVSGARQFTLKSVNDVLGIGVNVTGESGEGLGALAARLSSLVPTVSSVGASSTKSGGRAGGGSHGQSAQPRVIQPPAIVLLDGEPYLVARVRLPASEKAQTLVASVVVVVDGGAKETEPPRGAEVPVVLEWQPLDGSEKSLGATLVSRGGREEEWWVVVSYVPDALVRFQVRLDGA
ncbi:MULTISPECIES: hypothetical protein [Cryobacterium]|uniref:hypothetical protein n=1 Tax=Cryobacterium TaxID=69578 RepID=UPI001056FCA0|nr:MULTISPECIES: hypothetical protein [Cryobacterium]TFC42962.1 hypothetical protein E3O57_14650 [Cryobacterium sp. TMN-39-2]